MAFIPTFEVELLTGWIPIFDYLAILGIVVFSFKKDTVKRLYDRSLWSKKQRKYTIIGKSLLILNAIMLIFFPIHFETTIFYIGLTLYGIALLTLIVALYAFNQTPKEFPVTKSIYKVTRNPQILSILVIFLGISLMVGSVINILLLLGSSFCLHQLILAEEKTCLMQYGKEYQHYMQKVPRYILF